MQRTLPVLTIVALITLVGAVPTLAQTPPGCHSTHVVAAGDTLARIARAVFGKSQRYPVIVSATNAQARVDPSYHFIDDANELEVGWKLCIPSASTALASSPQERLTGAAWKWIVTLMNDGSRTTAKEPNRYLLTFLNNGKVSILADCNRILGTYTTERNRVNVTPGASTLVACPPGSLGKEFVTQLGNVGSYFFNGGNLVLELKFDSGSMTFAPTSAGIAGTRWTVVNYNNGREAVVTLLPESDISLDFGKDGRVSGNAGCNDYAGGYQSSGQQLSVGVLATTFKQCDTPDGLMEQEAQYLGALSRAATFEVAGDALTIRDRGGAMQVVARSSVPAELAGTSWNVTGINNGREAVVGTIAGTQPTMDFGRDNRVSGNAGCNSYAGRYEAAGNALRIGSLVAGEVICAAPAGVMEQERQFLTALENSATFEVSNRTLTIRDSGGAMQVIASVRNSTGIAGVASSVTGPGHGGEVEGSVVVGGEVARLVDVR